MLTPLLFFFLFTVSIDGCARMRPTEKDVTKGVCDQHDDSEFCQESTRTPFITSTSVIPSTTTTISTTTTAASNTCPAPMKPTNNPKPISENIPLGKNAVILIRDPVNLSKYWMSIDIQKKVEYKTHVVFQLDNKKHDHLLTIYCEHQLPISCLQTPEQLQRLDLKSCSAGDSVPYQMCQVDDKDIVNKVVVDFTNPSYHFYPNKDVRRCRYRTGVDLISYKRPDPNEKATKDALYFFAERPVCVKTARNEFYTANGYFIIRQFCTPDKCSLYMYMYREDAAAISLAVPKKKYDFKAQKNAEKSGALFTDEHAFLQDIVWLSEGICPPRNCDATVE
ncbi:hypothetical protein QR680_011791 [Steinernema hermaphroditum]|uniref:ZP domain-containing protein n=1 Tax=Steinernema hermaphroditum TaxID=289476 RepID=A0AA39LYN8_9BILA|nr:hypothetical protein QR680_011791 [Steinernema hermaphroditum]